MGAWAILAFCIVAEVSATSLLTRSEGIRPAGVRPPCTRNLGRLFLGPVSGPDSNTHGCGIRDLVWGWHSADLRRRLVILSATPHHHAGPVHRVGRCGCTRLEPINQSGLVRGTRGARLRGGICQKGYSTCEGVRNAVAMSFPGTQRSCRHSPNMSCLYRKLNSTIMLVEATHDRLRCDATFVLDSTMDWSVFAKRSMSPQLVVVGSILRQDPA